VISARSATVRGDAPRLTVSTGAVMVLAALAIFAAAYAVATVYGHDSDRKVENVDALTFPALEPSGTPLLTVVARGVAFDTDRIAVPADQPVHIRLDNIDAGIHHNIAIYRDRQASELVARGRLFDGPTVRDYRFDGFAAGAYYFQCDLHPAMNGSFIAE
jgi:plastocyanin